MTFPRWADTVVIGGGTSGAVVAGLLAEQSNQSVLVLEAGPDPGPFADGHWPPGLLDARALGPEHDWGYSSEATYANRSIPFERACVIGGCSAHNGCAAIWGSRADYDGWAALGLPGWSTDDLLPLFQSANRRMRVRGYTPSEVTPFHQACLESAAASGVPIVDDLNDLEQDEGMAPSPVNVWNGVRWNSAFAYLDPVRGNPNLTIVAGAMVDRIGIEQGQARVVNYVVDGVRHEVDAGRIIVAAGAYESPAVLMRSGVGEPNQLRALGIAPVHDLPGVGQNLHDHPAAKLEFTGSDVLENQMDEFASRWWMPEEQTIAKLRSSRYPAGEPGFDLHVYPVGGPDHESPTGWRWAIWFACMTPRSRGSVRLRPGSITAAPLIDHGYRSDAAGHDVDVLLAGLTIARRIAAREPLKSLIGVETNGASDDRDSDGLRQWLEDNATHYYHPCGTCKMGPESDPMAVTDEAGRVHGIERLYVADCSIMPVIPRANTNLPAVVVGEKIARLLLAE